MRDDSNSNSSYGRALFRDVRDSRDSRPHYDDVDVPDPEPSGITAPADLLNDFVAKSQSVLKNVKAKTGLDRREIAQRTEEYAHKMSAPLKDGTIAVFARKGGVGKSTVSAFLALLFAAHRGGRIAVVDADEESASLGWMLAPSREPLLPQLGEDLLAGRLPKGFRELRAYAARTEHGVDVFACDQTERRELHPEGLRRSLEEIRQAYDVVVVDVGTRPSGPTGVALLESCALGILVVGMSIDGVRAAERTLTWLDERSSARDVRTLPVVTVLNGITEDMEPKEIKRIEKLLGAKSHEVARLPWDLHLSIGHPLVSLDALSPATQLEMLHVAATSVDALRSRARRQRREPRRRVDSAPYSPRANWHQG